MALDEICEIQQLIADPEPDRTRNFSFRQTITASARVNTRSGNFRPAAAAMVCQATVQEFSNGKFVCPGPLTLVQHWLIGLHSKPVQIPQNSVSAASNLPGGVDVFNPDQPLATR